MFLFLDILKIESFSPFNRYKFFNLLIYVYFEGKYLLSMMEVNKENEVSHYDSDYEPYEMRDNKRHVL